MKKYKPGLTLTHSIELAAVESVQQADMIEYLDTLSPTERTELLGELYSQWETWRNEQMLRDEVNLELSNQLLGEQNG